MNLGELEAEFRDEVKDRKLPYLWDKPFVVRVANQAVAEACRRAHLLLDSETAEVCRYSLGAGDSFFELHPAIVQVERLTATDDATGTVYYLERLNVGQLDCYQSQWESVTGIPFVVSMNLQTRKGRFYRKPDRAMTLNLTATRIPLESEQMKKDKDSPVIDAQYHFDLVHWMKHRAYSRDDINTRNDAKAKEALGMFERKFGRSDPVTEEWMRRHGREVQDYSPLA